MTTKEAAAKAPQVEKRHATSARHRVKVPTVLQMESTECGAASLGMILAKDGRFVGLDELRVACGVSRDGATAKNLLSAARSYGLTTKALKREPEELRQLTFPLIVHWNFYHYLVVEGWYPGGWYLNDPGGGPRKCPDDEFDKSFTGITLSLQPGDEFAKGGKRTGIFRRVVASAGNITAGMIAAAIVGLMLLVPVLLIPALMTAFGNELNGLAGLAATGIVVGLVAAFATQTVLAVVQGLLSIRLSTRITVRLTAAMVDRLLRLPAVFHAQRGAGSIAQRALVIDQMSTGVSSLVLNVGVAAITSTVAALALLIIDPAIGLSAISIALLSAFFLRLTLRQSKDEAAKVLIDTIEVGQTMSAALTQVESIKAAGAEDTIIARGVAAINRQVEAQQKVNRRMLLSAAIPTFLSGLAILVIAGVAFLQIVNGRIDAGAFLAILAVSGILLGPLASLATLAEQAQHLRPALDQIDDVLHADMDEEWPDDDGSSEVEAPSSIIGDLRTEQVTFGYSPLADPIVTDLSLHVPPGGRVALVGPSGCGKSTISRLVTGLYRPWSGRVLIDGRTRSAHAPVVLTESIALVDQDITIFSGTIRDNITLWDPTISEFDIQQAVEDSQLSRDIAGRTGGLESVLREGGADLSGGQRQRLEIARALARNPRILILDEATSALDPPTEALIDQAIRRRGISCLVIAHRLSTIRDSDEIVVLDKGVVIERGTHESLVTADGAYARLVRSE